MNSPSQTPSVSGEQSVSNSSSTTTTTPTPPHRMKHEQLKELLPSDSSKTKIHVGAAKGEEVPFKSSRTYKASSTPTKVNPNKPGIRMIKEESRTTSLRSASKTTYTTSSPPAKYYKLSFDTISNYFTLCMLTLVCVNGCGHTGMSNGQQMFEEKGVLYQEVVCPRCGAEQPTLSKFCYVFFYLCIFLSNLHILIFFLFYFFLGTSDVSRGTVLQGTFVWDPGIISEVFSMMLLGLRFDDYRKLKTVGCASIQREDWNRLHVTFVDHGLHPTFLKALDLAWDFVWRRGEDEVGCWTRLFLLSDGFWQQRPKKNHVGDSDHGSMLFVDGLNGLVLCYAMVSKLKDKKNNIDGNKIHSAAMEGKLFRLMLEQLKALGFGVDFMGKDGDQNAPEIMREIFKDCELIRCWIHGHRTVYKGVKKIPTDYVSKSCSKCADLHECTHDGSKKRCGCEISDTGKSFKHTALSATGIAIRLQRSLSQMFTQLHNR